MENQNYLYDIALYNCSVTQKSSTLVSLGTEYQVQMIIVSALHPSSAKRMENGKNGQVVRVSIVCHLTVDFDFVVSDHYKHCTLVSYWLL